MLKGKDDEPILESTSLGWVNSWRRIHYHKFMFTREHGTSYERTYSLDILRIENRGEDD